MLNLTHLAAFHAVAEAGSVTAGAERLMVSQPAVSKQVRALERALATELFERQPKGVRLTDAGEVLAGHARRVFAAAAEAEEAVRDLRGLERGRLALAASPSVAAHLLPTVLVRFRRRFPNVRVGLEVERAALLHGRVAAGDAELGIAETKPTSHAVDATPLGTDPLVAVAPPRHPLARARRVTLARLAEHPFVVRSADGDGPSLAEREMAALGHPLSDVALRLGSTEAVKRAAAAGLGVAIVPRMAVTLEVAARHLAVVPVTGLTAGRTIYVLRPRGTRERKPSIAFQCILRHEWREYARRPLKSRDL